MNNRFATLAAITTLTLAAWAPAQAMTKDEYKAAKDRIAADYKADKKACDAMKDNAKDVCEKEAKGKEKIARAELEQNYKPGDKNARKVAEAKADAAYDIASEKCEDQKGEAMITCKKDARASHEAAIKAAKGKA